MAMYCPFCGVKNEVNPTQCFVCNRAIPSFETERSIPSKQKAGRTNGGAPIERFASVGDRMLAFLLDRALVVAILLVIAAVFADQLLAANTQLPSPVVAAASGGFALISAAFIYHFLFELGFGTTLGKAVMGLQVRNESDRGRAAAVAIRNALRVIDGVALYLIGFLLATFTRRRQRLGDVVAGTVVMEMPMSNGARAAMMVLAAALIVASVWIAAAICPSCLK